MNDLISPKYQMKLVKEVHDTICNEFNTNKEVIIYIRKFNTGENFCLEFTDRDYTEIDLLQTLHNMDQETLLKVAIDLGIDTPDFIPIIPTFKNDLKYNYKTAYDTFTKAYKQIDNDPSLAIGLANSALESIVKEILRNDQINYKLNGSETLYKLTQIILKEFNISNAENPIEIKTIGSSLLNINQAIEKLRSEKTTFHGKTANDFLINDSIYSYFIINSVATVGLFLNSYYRTKFQNSQPIIEVGND